MPSTRVPFKMTSASISIALKTAAESVVKYGFPVPPPKITTRPFSTWRIAFLRINGSATCLICTADCNRVGTPASSRSEERRVGIELDGQVQPYDGTQSK